MSFTQPTPIQKACIPVGLLGRDICACAATGTGKTAAFMLPVLERLIYKPQEALVTRVLVLVPTRELGIQVHAVTRQLAQFTTVTCCLTVAMSYMFVSQEQPIVLGKKKQSKRNEDFNADFFFGERDGQADDSWVMDDVMKQLKKRVATSLDEKIETVRKRRKNPEKNEKILDKAETEEVKSEDEEEKESSENEESPEEFSSSEEAVLTKADTLRVKEKKKKTAGNSSFFEDASQYDENLTFQDMNLSRPLLKAISAMSFTQPTPIQKACIPVGLLGRDICACAATGTGKTAAFMLPVLERLIYKPQEALVTRVLVLVPTRELGIQVHAVTRQLAQFTTVTCCLTVAVESEVRVCGVDVTFVLPGDIKPTDY
ncbi:unnamed protein product [Ranitomeya imitator]|uniref:RNA helicase n=1 Tax=Ranitomeya imitator TaxID=111125 RepID=A0ABN9MEM3_9NEOB|nr:unnamed protein product [Ranitomeya imitator]